MKYQPAPVPHSTDARGLSEYLSRELYRIAQSVGDIEAFNDGASASAGTFLRGDGEWSEADDGWAQYDDVQYSASATFSATGSARQQLTLTLDSSASAATIDMLRNAHEGHSFFDGGVFVPLATGRHYLIRVAFQARSATTNSAITLQLDIGGSFGVIYEDRQDLHPNAGTYRLVTFLIPIYSLDTFVANNGTIYVRGDDDIDIYDIQSLVFPL